MSEEFDQELKGKQLWRFSFKIYGDPGMKEAFLALQNRNGFDVNMLLFCCWGGLTFGMIPEDILVAAINYSNGWRLKVVKPLRDIRIWMRGGRWEKEADKHVELRKQVQAVELEAERLQQSMLEHFTEDLTEMSWNHEKALDGILANLGFYIRNKKISINLSACDNLTVILSAVLCNLDYDTIRSKLEFITTTKPF